jgi:hypothetical protein
MPAKQSPALFRLRCAKMIASAQHFLAPICGSRARRAIRSDKFILMRIFD